MHPTTCASPAHDTAAYRAATYGRRPGITTNEAAARTRKAHGIARTLHYHGATADDAGALPAVGRRMAALLAQVPPPSDTTWACVVALLREWEAS